MNRTPQSVAYAAHRWYRYEQELGVSKVPTRSTFAMFSVLPKERSPWSAWKAGRCALAERDYQIVGSYHPMLILQAVTLGPPQPAPPPDCPSRVNPSQPAGQAMRTIK